jgi:hypothetical protein
MSPLTIAHGRLPSRFAIVLSGLPHNLDTRQCCFLGLSIVLLLVLSRKPMVYIYRNLGSEMA